MLHDEVNVGSSDLHKAETEKMELEGKISTVNPEMTKLLKELTAKCADAQRGLGTCFISKIQAHCLPIRNDTY